MKKKIVIIVVVLVIVLAVGGYFLWKKLKENKEPETTPEGAKKQAEIQAIKEAVGNIKVNPIQRIITRLQPTPKTKISEPIISKSGAVFRSNENDILAEEIQLAATGQTEKLAEVRALRKSIGAIKPMSINQVRIAPKTRISEPLPLRRTIQPLF